MVFDGEDSLGIRGKWVGTGSMWREASMPAGRFSRNFLESMDSGEPLIRFPSSFLWIGLRGGGIGGDGELEELEEREGEVQRLDFYLEELFCLQRSPN